MRNIEDIHHYQWKTVDHILVNVNSGVFLDMGLGKTVSTLTAIQKLIFEEVEIDKVLVVGPKRVAESVWAQEVSKWSHLSSLKVTIISGKAKKREEKLKENSHIYTISRDNIQWLCAKYGGSSLPFDMLVIDESSSFKNHKSKRFKALRLVQFKKKVILTGTPSPNGLMDLWSQIYLLDKGERLGRTIGAYRSDFFRPGRTNGHIVYNYRLNSGSEERIYEAISDICISMKAEDYLELPKAIENPIYIEMGPTLSKMYRNFEREKVLEIIGTGDQITPANAAALSNKLLQFANGAIYDSEREVHHIHDLKLEVLEEIMEEANGKPVLIAYTFKPDAERILKHFSSYKPRKLQTDKDIVDWNEGKIRMMIMHPASGGHGLNLQDGGNIVVWFGQTWSLELLQQFNKRLDRQGQKQRVIIHKLILKGSMDEDVIMSQIEKATGQDALMEALKVRVSKYLKIK